MKPPPEQEAIRAKCFHPSGTFVEFSSEDVEQSIPARFETIARRYANRIAVQSDNQAITYAELNKAANRLARSILSKQRRLSAPIAVFGRQGVFVSSCNIGSFENRQTRGALGPFISEGEDGNHTGRF
jgi:hypothetical protein